MNDYGHTCPRCGSLWAAMTCISPQSIGYQCSREPADCPTCDPKHISSGWKYLEDEFTQWVRKTRKEAGLVP